MVGQFRSRYRAGDWVRIRSRDEIMRTLDEHGMLDGLPFMPEMLAFCGRRLRVAASAHKTCDTVHYTGGRRMRDAVHLEDARCDGSMHDGCQARCLIFWKEAWLEPVAESLPHGTDLSGTRVCEAQAVSTVAPAPCNESILRDMTCDRKDAASPTYSCQATRLFAATTPLAAWRPMQYIADVRSGNVSVGHAAKFLSLALLYNLRRMGFAYRFWCSVYEHAHQRLMGCKSPYVRGEISAGMATPRGELGLQSGEWVEVRSVEEIVRTIDERNRNRGLSFDKEMVRYCGQRFRVLDRVRRIINETTGKMLELPNPAIALEGTYCTSRYSERRLLCPRRIVPYWREIWLKRVEGSSRSAAPPAHSSEP